MSDQPKPIHIIVCYTTCWACKFNHHDKEWHSWADADDVAYARESGQSDPSSQRCGCHCQHEEATS